MVQRCASQCEASVAIGSRCWEWMACALAALLLPCVELHAAPTTLPCVSALEAGPTRAVARAIDGETVLLDDGVEVRLIGALAPRARDAGLGVSVANWPPASAAHEALETLVGGRSVALAFASKHRSDRYGRVLAHLVVQLDTEQIWVQGRLVETGQARAYALPGGEPCLAALVALERKARTAGLGLWSHAAYQIRPADRPTELARYRHTFQLVRGRVERVRETRGLEIIELTSGERPAAAEGKSQWDAFHVIWRKAVMGDSPLGKTKELVGRNVLVRGWIDDRRGPEVELVAASQLELEE